MKWIYLRYYIFPPVEVIPCIVSSAHIPCKLNLLLRAIRMRIMYNMYSGLAHLALRAILLAVAVLAVLTVVASKKQKTSI
jgi:hypothetical protein